MLIDIQPFLTYARSEYLYSLEEGFGYFTPITVFAVSISKGEEINFQIMTEGNILFPNIPIRALANSKTSTPLETHSFDVCPDDNATIIQHDYLNSIGSCGVWHKDGTLWSIGTYLFTIEWHNAKRQMHFIELEDGNYVMWADSHIIWGNDMPEKLPGYGRE